MTRNGCVGAVTRRGRPCGFGIYAVADTVRRCRCRCVSERVLWAAGFQRVHRAGRRVDGVSQTSSEIRRSSVALGVSEQYRSEPHGLWERFGIEFSSSLLAKVLVELLLPACAVGVWYALVFISILHIPDTGGELKEGIDSPEEFTNARVRSSGITTVRLSRTTIPSPTRGDSVTVSSLERIVENLRQQVLQITDDYNDVAARARQLQEIVDRAAQPTQIGFFADLYEVWQSPAPRHEFVDEDIRLSLTGDEPLRTAPEWAFERCDDNVDPEPTGGNAGPVFIFSVPAKTSCLVTISYHDGETRHRSGYWVNIRRSRSEEIGAAPR